MIAKGEPIETLMRNIIKIKAYHVKSRVMKLLEDFLDNSEDREPGDDDEEDEGNHSISKLAIRLIAVDSVIKEVNYLTSENS